VGWWFGFAKKGSFAQKGMSLPIFDFGFRVISHEVELC